jgi:glycosyltransferase involved in cell wall biosynthesis
MNAPSTASGDDRDVATRTCVVIPAYNEAEVIGPVVEGLIARGFDVVVVDDASTDATAERAQTAGAVMLRHLINRGQGAALQTGILRALQSKADFIVTFDADGQHDPNDVLRLVQPLAGNERDVVLGSRFLASPDAVPFSRRLLLRVAVIFTRAASGLPVTDAHNGLRAFSSSAASAIRIRQDRMAHASELVDQVRDRRLRWCEVPVTVRYTPYSRRKGQSHFGVFRILFDYISGRWTS